MVKNPAPVQETWVWSLACEGPLKKGMETTPVLPGEFHGQESLAICSPWGHKELDTTERLTQQYIERALLNEREKLYLNLFFPKMSIKVFVLYDINY